MTRSLLIFLGALGLSATPVIAEPDMGAQLQLQFARNVDDSDVFKRIAGAFNIGISDSIDLQFDIAASKYTAVDSTAPTAGVHLAYALSDDVTAGVFFTAEDQQPGNYYAYGVEIDYASDRFGAQAYYGMLEDITLDLSGSRYGLDAEFGLFRNDSILLLAGAHGQSIGGADQSFAYVGASYELRNGTVLGLTAGQNDHGDTIASFTATFAFGHAPTFNSRDGRSLMAGY